MWREGLRAGLCCGWARPMDQIVLTKSLRTVGFDSHDILRMRQRGELVPVRRGAYAATGLRTKPQRGPIAG